MSQIDLYYWRLKGRAYPTMAVAQAGGLNLKLTIVDLPAMKAELPFGQIPYMVDGDIKLAHSNAILRYVARKAGLEGESIQAYAASNMLIEEAADIYNLLVLAHYGSGDRVKGYENILADGGPLYKQLGYLEALHPGDGPYFNNQTDKRVAGAYAIACTLDILVNLEPTILANYPKLDLFYKTLYATSAFDGLRDFDNHFLRP